MTEISDTGPLRSAHVRLLKIAVVVMGLLILSGMAAVVLRIVYLASRPTVQTSSAGSGLEARARLALPPGAAIRLMALSGDRLAVHYDAPAGPGIAIVDVATGMVVSRIAIVPEPPR
jgi:hypothetical protein